MPRIVAENLQRNSTLHRSFFWRLLVVVPFLGLVGLAGCTDAGPSNVVTGLVTTNGNPVAGEVAFIGSDNKTVTAATAPDGTYFINDPPLGKVKITVKAIPGMMTKAPQTPKDKSTDLAGKSTMKMGVAPPAKYASPDNGLTYEVKAGKQKKDIELP